MDPGSLLFGLGQLVPSLLRLAGKDNAAAVADKAVTAAKVLTGKEDPNAAIDAIKANPELLARFQQMANEIVIAELEAETRRLEAVNATMRAEVASADPFVRRARPSFIYAMAVSWSIQMLAISAAIIIDSTSAGTLISAATGLTGMWAVALAVIGVYFKSRSDDKKVAAGMEAPSMLSSIGALMKRG